MRLIPKNWAKFQHYKDRNPPWIKLHKELLNDPDFMTLPLACVGLAQMLWLLASEGKDGSFDASMKNLVFRLRKTEAELRKCLNPLIDSGFFVVLATCKQALADDTESCSETEGETEGETQHGDLKIPPRIEDVRAYCQERNNGIDADEWWNFYESKGWMIGKNKMKKWKAAIATWEKGKASQAKPVTPVSTLKPVDPERLARIKQREKELGLA